MPRQASDYSIKELEAIAGRRRSAKDYTDEELREIGGVEEFTETPLPAGFPTPPEPLTAEPSLGPGITRGTSPVEDTTSPFRKVAGGLPDVAEGLGKTAFEFAKFLPAFGVGATALLPSGAGPEPAVPTDEFDPATTSQGIQPEQPGPFAKEPKGLSQKLVVAQERFEKVAGFGQTPLTREGAQQIAAAISMPFEALEKVTLPAIKKVMVASGFEGDAQSLDKAARFVYSGTLIAATAGVAKGVKGAAKGRTPKVRDSISAKTFAQDRRITALEERAGLVEPKAPKKAAPKPTPVKPVTAKAPALKVKAAEKPVKPAVTPEPVTPKPKVKVTGKPASLRAQVVEAKAELKAHKKEKKRIKLVKKAEKIEAVQEQTLRASEAGIVDVEKLAGELPGRTKAARELVGKRGSDIAINKLEDAKTIRDIKFGGKKLTGIKEKLEGKGARAKFSKAEREAITLLRQGIKDTATLKKIGKENLIPLIEKPTPEMLRAVNKVGEFFEKKFKFMVEEGKEAGLNYIDNYVTQIWDIPKNKKALIPSGFKTNNPFTKARKIPSIEEGIKLGFKPKTLDIAEIMETYSDLVTETVHNKRLVESLGKLKYLNETTKQMEPLVMRADRAPSDWPKIDHPALNRSKAIGKTADGGIILSKQALAVHPEIESILNNIFGKRLGSNLGPFGQNTINAVTVMNSFIKTGQLSLSLFHGIALMESAASSGNLLRSWGLLEPFRAYRAIKRGDFEIFKNMELSKDAIENGRVQIGAISDVQKGIVDKALRDMENATKGVPGLGQFARGTRAFKSTWDAALWDYIHNTLKLYAYEKQVGIEITRRMKLSATKDVPLTAKDVLSIKRTVGSFVNDSFGGQNWDLAPALGSPAMRQLAQLVFLSPDWTVSTLKQAGAVPIGAAKQLAGGITGNKMLAREGSVQFKRSTAFWLRSALYFNIIAQTVNYAASKKKYGEGRFTNENAPGKELDILIGENPDGTERYMRTGKQFREVMEWREDPVKKFGAKMSPMAREAVRQLTKHDPGSGFPAEFADDDIWSPESIRKRGISFVSMPVPFSLRSFISDRPANIMAGWPTSRGMTRAGARGLFAKAIKKAKKTGDAKQIQRVYISALENNLDAEAIYNQTKAQLKSDITYDNKTIARKILIELGQMKTPEQRKDLIAHYKKRKILSLPVFLELEKLQKKKAGVKKQQGVLKLIRKKDK